MNEIIQHAFACAIAHPVSEWHYEIIYPRSQSELIWNHAILFSLLHDLFPPLRSLGFHHVEEQGTAILNSLPCIGIGHSKISALQDFSALDNFAHAARSFPNINYNPFTMGTDMDGHSILP